MRPLVFISALLLSFVASATPRQFSFKAENKLVACFKKGDIECFSSAIREYSIRPGDMTSHRCPFKMMHILGIAKPTDGKYRKGHKEILDLLLAKGFELSPRRVARWENSSIDSRCNRETPPIGYMGKVKDTSMLRWMVEAGAPIYDVFRVSGNYTTLFSKITQTEAEINKIEPGPYTKYFVEELNYDAREAGACVALADLGSTGAYSYYLRYFVEIGALPGLNDYDYCGPPIVYPGFFD